jgi:hypothetical protein
MEGQVTSMSHEQQEAERLLAGLESGSMDTGTAQTIAEDLDPVMIYVIVSFLRATYPASDPAATPVLERVVAMTSKDQAIIRNCKLGEQDPISRWFQSEYSFKEFRGRGPELIALITDKLES